jgi:hypothetical protein
MCISSCESPPGATHFESYEGGMVKNISTNSSAFDLNARRLSDAEEMDMRETYRNCNKKCLCGI